MKIRHNFPTGKKLGNERAGKFPIEKCGSSNWQYFPETRWDFRETMYPIPLTFPAEVGPGPEFHS